MSEDNPKIKDAMDKILKLFESDNLEVVTRAVFQYPEGATYARPSDKWSFLNRLIMLINETEDARGYNQWHDAGRVNDPTLKGWGFVLFLNIFFQYV